MIKAEYRMSEFSLLMNFVDFVVRKDMRNSLSMNFNEKWLLIGLCTAIAYRNCLHTMYIA